MRPDPDRLAAALVTVLTKTLAPLLTRLAMLERRADAFDAQTEEIAALRAESAQALAALRAALEAQTPADPPTDDAAPAVRH
jgi:hypothetical protein